MVIRPDHPPARPRSRPTLPGGIPVLLASGLAYTAIASFLGLQFQVWIWLMSPIADALFVALMLGIWVLGLRLARSQGWIAILPTLVLTLLGWWPCAQLSFASHGEYFGPLQLLAQVAGAGWMGLLFAGLAPWIVVRVTAKMQRPPAAP